MSRLVDRRAARPRSRPNKFRKARCRRSAGRPKAPIRCRCFDFDTYFLGKWTFEWSMPESPLGPAGTYTGRRSSRKSTDVSTKRDRRRRTRRDRSRSASSSRITRKTRRWRAQVTDSRGFSYMQFGPVGGDLGGIYNIHFDSAPFTVNGKSVRVRTRHALALATQLSSGELHLGRRRAVHESGDTRGGRKAP